MLRAGGQYPQDSHLEHCFDTGACYSFCAFAKPYYALSPEGRKLTIRSRHFPDILAKVPVASRRFWRYPSHLDKKWGHPRRGFRRFRQRRERRQRGATKDVRAMASTPVCSSTPPGGTTIFRRWPLRLAADCL